MSDSDFDGDFEKDFDKDDELRALLRGGDPAGSLSPAEAAALAILLEDIMSADLDVRPEVDEGSRATGTHGRNRLTWLVAAAAVTAIAAGGAFAVNGLSGTDSNPPQADHTTVKGDTSVTAATTVLGVAKQEGRCAPPTPAILAQYPQAFAGTVTAIEGDTVTIETTDVYAGEVAETVEVTAPPAQFGPMLSAVQFQVGGDYLVAAFDGQLSMCYSGTATGDLRSPFEKAFVR